MTKEEIVKVIKLASSRDMIREVTSEISKKFSHYDEKTGLVLQDAAPDGYLTERIAEKVYNQLYKPIDEDKLNELAINYAKKWWSNPSLYEDTSYAHLYKEEYQNMINCRKDFKAGYRKAKEE